MTDTTSEAIEGAAAQVQVAGTEAGAAVVTAASDVVEAKKDAENDVHGLIAEVEAFFGRIGKDISAEIAAIKAKL